jgi:hypothetical protein
MFRERVENVWQQQKQTASQFKFSHFICIKKRPLFSYPGLHRIRSMASSIRHWQMGKPHNLLYKRIMKK